MARGSVQWRRDPAAAPFHGDLLLRCQPDSLHVLVSKGPGAAFLELRATAARWQITLPSENRTLAGRDHPAPRPLALWLELRAAADQFAHPVAEPDPAPLRYRRGRREYELIRGDFLPRGAALVPTRVQIADLATGASLEIKIHELR